MHEPAAPEVSMNDRSLTAGTPTDSTMTDQRSTEHSATDRSEQSPETAPESLSREIDALSLSQALVDFEMANARVLDLMARLVEANERVVRFGREAAQASDARAAADETAAIANRATAQTEAERDALRATIAILNRELDAHREVITARDRDASMLHGEIAARDEVIRVRTSELVDVRASGAYRIGTRLAKLTRRFR